MFLYFREAYLKQLGILISLLTCFILLAACNGEKPTDQTKQADNTPVAEIPEIIEKNPQAISREEKSQPGFNWQKLSGWHTQGTISRDKPIRIVFNHAIITEDRVGKDASNVMLVNPKIEGNPVFESKTEIVWFPTKQLQSGTKYKVTIKASGLQDIPLDTPPFQFSFQVIPLEFEVSTFGLTPIESQQPSNDKQTPENHMLLKGQLLISDRVTPANVQKVLEATQQNKRLGIEWNHSADGKKHAFVISGITRETFATDVKLAWNGKPINIEAKGSREIKIPALNDFSITRVHVVHGQGVNPYVQVEFSDQLEKTQNLNGLVRLDKNKIRLTIQNNAINIYPNKNLSGAFKVSLSEGIKGLQGQVLSKPVEQEVKFDDVKPQVRFVGNGSILPENSTLSIPFEAVAANAAQVTAFEIYPQNMRQFLQVNRLSGDYETRRTGRFLWRKTIPLNPADPNKWNRFSFDVTNLMKGHKGGLIRLTLEINRQLSAYDCPAKNNKAETKINPMQNLEDNGVQEVSGWDGISDYVEQGNNYDYRWNERNNPCDDAYFNYNQDKTTSSQNFIASNIGLIAKQDANKNLSVISTDIRTAEPLTGVDLEVRNYQGQVLATAKSDGSGFAKIPMTATPFLVTAKKFDDIAYLKVNTNTAMAISQFDVGGKKIEKGIKGTIYAERGVWRPGDDIYLTFVLEDKTGKIPPNHPLTMKLIDPKGRVVDSKTSLNSIGGFYSFTFKTAEKAETGQWMAKAYLGGATFSKSLMIETIRPNRLKVDLTFSAGETLYNSEGIPHGKLFSQWLHGATAGDLKADVSLKLSAKKTSFGRFDDYTFDDPTRRLKSEDKMILQGRLDNQGYLEFDKDIQPKTPSPGMLKATFTSRVFEQGGAFSIARNSFDYHPFDHYVGIKLPKGDATRDMLLTDKPHTVEIASLNAKGEPVSLDQIEVKLYKINWKWWWDKTAESLAEYSDGKNTGLIQQQIIHTKDGKGSWNFSIKYPEWGRYLIRACDLQGKHCAGKTVFIDWPGWAGRAQEEGSGAASRLNIFSDKATYSVGDTAYITLPDATKGRALLSIETGSEILDQRWIVLGNKDSGFSSRTKLEIPITAAMSPNAYVNVSLIQPHKDKTNDRPIRLYGIIPIEVTNPDTYLKPILEAGKEWKPETTQTIKVTEATGKAMNYTLAIVDEGLLGLTGFKTPDLHKVFYSKEALGIKTWDLFDEVIGAYGGKLERMLAIGGGDEVEVDNEDSKKRRFPPVVKVLGPFHLEPGKIAEHAVTLPAYLGAVRVMLVAGEKGAYGKAEQSVFVRQPLMLQASLPRVLGPDEEVSVPVTLFVTDNSIKKVRIRVETDELIKLIQPESANAYTELEFTSPGEKLVFVRLKTANMAGKAKVKFIAESLADETSQTTSQQPTQPSASEINLDIRLANEATSRISSQVIDAGESWNSELKPYGIAGSNHAVLELSSVPALNLENRLQYLIRYPHGCLEQTTSSVFPQLYLSNVMALDNKRQQDVEYHVNKAIEKLSSFQNGVGNFSYWPGANDSNAWASVYAGHFLVEAQKRGYLVPPELLGNWFTYQVETAQNYLIASEQYSHIQAYRLYVLALAGKPQLGAMNRLRESSKLNTKARWMLASAYQAASQPEAANALIQGMTIGMESVDAPDRTFSSTLGDLGIQLESLVALNKKQDANLLLEKIAEEMNSDDFQSTQGIAWALMSVSRYLGGDTSHFTANFTRGATPGQEISSKKPISSLPISYSAKASTGENLKIENTSGIKLFATLINQGVPKAGDEIAIQQGLTLKASYQKRDSADKTQWQETDISQPVAQGDDIRIQVSVTNETKRKTDNIALTIPVASGMEIFSAEEQPRQQNKYDYRDLRDDRIYYYFPLKPGETKTFGLMVNASYQGTFYLPAINADAMYDGKMQARIPGRKVSIVKKESLLAGPSETSSGSPVDNKSRNVLNTGDPITISIDKAWLYNAADENSRTTMYLIKNDQAELLDRKIAEDNTRWYLVRFVGKKTLEKWIRAESTE